MSYDKGLIFSDKGNIVLSNISESTFTDSIPPPSPSNPNPKGGVGVSFEFNTELTLPNIDEYYAVVAMYGYDSIGGVTVGQWVYPGGDPNDDNVEEFPGKYEMKIDASTGQSQITSWWQQYFSNPNTNSGSYFTMWDPNVITGLGQVPNQAIIDSGIITMRTTWDINIRERDNYANNGYWRYNARLFAEDIDLWY